VIAYQMTEKFEGAKVLFLEGNKVARVIEYPRAT
jgi:hypothetical protein